MFMYVMRLVSGMVVVFWYSLFCIDGMFLFVLRFCIAYALGAVFFKRNPATVHRLLPWLTREFRVLLGVQHVDFMIQLVLSLIEK